MKIRIVPVAAGLAGATALAITGAALANVDPSSPAATTSTATAVPAAAPPPGSATAPPQPPDSNGITDPSTPMRTDEYLLTGTMASKVTAAARTPDPTSRYAAWPSRPRGIPSSPRTGEVCGGAGANVVHGAQWAAQDN